MMTAEDTSRLAVEAGITLEVIDGWMRYRSRAGLFTPLLRSAIAAHEDGIIELLTRDLIKADKRAPITSIGVLLRLAPLAVYASMFEIRGAPLNGAQLVLYPDPTDLLPAPQSGRETREYLASRTHLEELLAQI
jgi:hypothetical protein